jgi:transcriptional regulator with XRE-family HTH domain
MARTANHVPAEVLRAAREKQDKTQQDIADELDVSQALISKWESGTPVPSKKLRLVAKVYGVRPERLIPDEANA